MEPAPYLSEEVLGRLPLFPLPATVFFPGTELNLHVFEARYREMIRHCLKTDAALAVVLLKPGFEADYYGRPPIFEVAGAGKILHAEELPDGRFEIVLWGTDRVRIIEELPASGAFRVASCRRIDDQGKDPALEQAERCLRSLALRLADCVEEIKDPLLRLLQNVDEGSGTLADQIACRLIPDPFIRQAVLEERDLGRRLEQVTSEVAEVCLRLDHSCKKDHGPLN